MGDLTTANEDKDDDDATYEDHRNNKMPYVDIKPITMNMRMNVAHLGSFWFPAHLGSRVPAHSC